MFKKIALHFWSARQQFWRYFIVGFSGLFIDLGTLYVLSNYFQVKPYLAVVINGLLMINYTFFLNKHWTFKSNGATQKQIIRFFMLAGLNYLIAVGWMFIFNHKIGVNYLFARFSNIAVAVAWNFFLYKYWIYKHQDVLVPPSELL